MRITPRYEGAAVINVDAVVRSPSTALVRQRARLAESLRGLSTEEWNTPSRCGGWTVQDVVEHLIRRWYVSGCSSSLGASVIRRLPTRALQKGAIRRHSVLVRVLGRADCPNLYSRRLDR
jgi:hypothetical protein